MRRRFHPWVLGLLAFLCGLQLALGSTVHVLSHAHEHALTEPGAPSHADTEDAPPIDAEFCDLCLALSSLAHNLATAPGEPGTPSTIATLSTAKADMHTPGLGLVILWGTARSPPVHPLI